MFELKTGMVVEFCDRDVGIVINNKICCNSCYVSFSNVSMEDMFGDNNTSCCAVKTVYKNDTNNTIYDMFDLDNYDEEDIIWQRNVQLKEGDVFICTNLIVAGLYHVNVNQHYLKTKDGVVMVDKSILPYLKSEVKEIS